MPINTFFLQIRTIFYKIFFIFRILVQAWSIKRSFWIGLIKHGSLWLWVNGEYAAPTAIYWEQNLPDNSFVNRRCGQIRTTYYGRTTADSSCLSRRIALCEKKYFPNN